ncbi:MAG: glycosyltransferase family 1 protein [Clostridia bacterium]|nr:glycosyltransferase family 1 protein [Clostridia bacterium]
MGCKRILQVVSTLNRGGIESMIMNLYRKVDREKIQFDFIVQRDPNGAFSDEIKALGGRIYKAPHYDIVNDFQYKKWWREFFQTHKEYKVIHSHSYTFASIHLKIANRYGLKTIVHSHTAAFPKGLKGVIHWFYQRNVAEIPDYLFSCSDKAGKWLYGKNCKERKNYILLKNAVDTDKYIYNENTRQQLRKEFGIENRFVVGHIGSFSEPKNHSYLIEVFNSISKNRKDAVLLLVGGGVFEKRIKAQIDSLGLGEKVIFAGVRTDVNKLLQAIDCFVFPSLYEGLPVSVIEAQAAGLPCFISDRVTDEVCVTDLVEMLSIDEEPTVWSEKILAKANGFVRENMKEQIAKSGYDIESTAKWLTEFYINCEGE